MPMELPRDNSHNSLYQHGSGPHTPGEQEGPVAGSAAQGVGLLLGFYSGISLLIPLAGSCLTCCN